MHDGDVQPDSATIHRTNEFLREYRLRAVDGRHSHYASPFLFDESDRSGNRWELFLAWGVAWPNASDFFWLETPSGLFTTKQRAMVKVEAKSMVGILFDDIPTSIRTKAKALIDAKDDDYWRDLATQQMQYTQIRLLFRPLYNTDIEAPSKRGTLSLTLPKLFEFEFTTPPKFTTIDGHVPLCAWVHIP